SRWVGVGTPIIGRPRPLPGPRHATSRWASGRHRLYTLIPEEPVFDALVNNLTSGLPAELNARRQQYEYYRDKLLTFKELKS
ncbi:hypothetical protein FAM15300_001504, partial [Propionibacterium freudenreichii]|nr:hypothetical protein [Propionibacterium freudenreichii]